MYKQTKAKLKQTKISKQTNDQKVKKQTNKRRF